MEGSEYGYKHRREGLERIYSSTRGYYYASSRMVWNTNVALAQLQNDLGDAEEAVVVIEQKILEADSNSKAIISIEKDIEYMKQTLGRIETLVASL